jgi:riboflavin kinase/FMN adenylyltransferase
MLDLLVRSAAPLRLRSHAVTFDPHPGMVLGRGAPPLLTSLDRRADLVHSLGVDDLSVCPFDADLASWPPRRFVEELLVGALGAKLVVVGTNFRFGAQRAGDFALLQSLGLELGFHAEPAPLAGDDQGPWSSSRARDAIRAGDVVEAAHVLGRPHSFEGTVVRGAQRGRTIGFPTANLAEIIEMIPKRGVYAVDVVGIGRGVMNIGVRPTVSGESETCEVFVLDWSGDLYGKRIRVELLSRIRDEKKFASLDELKAQIAKDADATRAHRPA